MSTRFADRSLPPTARLVGEVMRGLDPRRWKASNATEAVALGIHSLRSGLFTAESLPLLFIDRPSGGQKSKPPPEGALEVTLARLRALLEHDAALIGSGAAPLSVLAPHDPLGHGGRLLRILADGQTVSRRKRQRDARAFGRKARRWLAEMPSYYQRNFHYQTDGYLSERSAELYEHQVELLFRGGADAMRRLIVPALKLHFGDHDGRGLRFLELGSGTGIGTRSVARCFPEARITALDLSPPYTRYARRRADDLERVDFVQGDAAGLEFGDERFDAVYSIFLFHELPLPVREQVLEESLRVLRPGGLMGLVDSLQRGDDPELDWALEFFPREFHEPYYANYAARPMQTLAREAGFEAIREGTGYLSKWLSARKPAAEPEVLDPAA